MTHVTTQNQPYVIEPPQDSYKQRSSPVSGGQWFIYGETCSKDSKLCRNQAIKPPRTSTFEALSYTSFKALKNFYIKIFKYEEHSKIIHSNHSSKLHISIGFQLQSLWKLQELWSIKYSSDSSPKAPKKFHLQAFKYEEHMKIMMNKKSLTSVSQRFFTILLQRPFDPLPN